MPKQFLISVAIVLTALAALASLSSSNAVASGFESSAAASDVTDADFCFGPGNQGVGFACNSICFAVPAPSDLGLPITCPGPAAAITFASSPSTVSCASQSTLSVTVADAKNVAVADDTVVTFTTDGGVVTSTSATTGGLAYASFTVPPKTSGVARIVATVGTVRAEKRIELGC
jgi:hypothetical protein